MLMKVISSPLTALVHLSLLLVPLRSPLGNPQHVLSKPFASLLLSFSLSLPTTYARLALVLCKFVAPLCVFHNERYGTALKVSDFNSYEFTDVWGGDYAETQEKMRLFYESSYMKDLPEVPGSVAVLRDLHQRYPDTLELRIVTSRQNAAQQRTCPPLLPLEYPQRSFLSLSLLMPTFPGLVTREWVKKHIGEGVFRELLFGNHYSESGPSIPKSELCSRFDAHVLIDDSAKYAQDCARAGTRVLLFTLGETYHWNQVRRVWPTEEVYSIVALVWHVV